MLPFPLRHCAGRHCRYLTTLPPSQPGSSSSSSLWATCFLATFISADPPPFSLPSAPHVWFVLRLFSLGCSENYFPTSFYYILVFNLNAACMSMPGRQAYQACQPAPCLPLNFCQIVQQLSSPVAVRQCTMWSVVQLLKRVDVVACCREKLVDELRHFHLMLLTF